MTYFVVCDRNRTKRRAKDSELTPINWRSVLLYGAKVKTVILALVVVCARYQCCRVATWRRQPQSEVELADRTKRQAKTTRKVVNVVYRVIKKAK